MLASGIFNGSARLSTSPINPPCRTSSCILVQIQPINDTGGITAHPPGQPWRVISRPVIIEPALRIAFLAGEAIALARKAAEQRLAVGAVFLAVDPGAGTVDDDHAAVEVIAELVLYRRPLVLRRLIARAHARAA